jgi:hypothetical protein
MVVARDSTLFYLPINLPTHLLVMRSYVESGMDASGEGRNRTGDTTVFSRVLYQLSYLARRGVSLAAVFAPAPRNAGSARRPGQRTDFDKTPAQNLPRLTPA